jgi:hypothetical protein
VKRERRTNMVRMLSGSGKLAHQSRSGLKTP